MCNNCGCGGNNNFWWIIILALLLCNGGIGQIGGCNNGCSNGCGEYSRTCC